MLLNMKTDEDHISNSAHVKVARVPQKAKRQDVALAQHSLLEPVIDAAISFARHHNSRRDRLADCFLADWICKRHTSTSFWNMNVVLLRLASAGLAPRLKKETLSAKKFGLTRCQVICPFQVPKEMPTKVPKVPRKRRGNFCGALKLNSEMCP